MTKLCHTKTQPPLYYVHSESDLPSYGVEGSYGLAAGYLDSRRLRPIERDTWNNVFERRWQDSCLSLAKGLHRMGADSFVIVPCSRADVFSRMHWSLRAEGFLELPGLIRKIGPTVSFGSKDQLYIARNTSLNIPHGLLNEVEVLAVCDDFAETGKTLFGLYALLSSVPLIAQKRIVLAAVGVSAELAEPSNYESLRSTLKVANIEEL